MPYLSVVCPTFRIGGIDVLFDGLQRQHFKDFELVLSDCLYKSRAKEVEEDARKFPGIRFKHVEPEPNIFPVSAFAACSNTALRHAHGEVVVFITDYTWLPSNCLEAHAEFHKQMGVNHALLLPHWYVLPPKHNMPQYDNLELEAYIADLESGKLDALKVSLWNNAQDYANLPEDTQNGYDRKCTELYESTTDEMAFHGKNESMKISAVLDVGGWNEAFDGSHPYQDSELAARLAYDGGMYFWTRREPLALIVNMRHTFPLLKRLRPPDANRIIWLNSMRAALERGRTHSWR